MSSQNIYLTINKEIFSDPFYNFCKTDSKRLVAWYFLNVLSFSEDMTQDGIIGSDTHHFIDFLYFDDENGVAYVAGSDFRGIHDKLDVLSFNRPFNFFKYMISSKEYELTGDPKLDRKSFYLHDCIRRGYKVVFMFITTASFDEHCMRSVEQIRMRSDALFDFDFIIELIDGAMLSDRFYEADSLERAVQTGFEPLGELPVSVGAYACELTIEDRQASALFMPKLKSFWTAQAGGMLNNELLAIGPEKGSLLQLYSILEGYRIANKVKVGLLPPISLVYFNLERFIFSNRIIAVSASWVNAAFDRARKRTKGISPAHWIETELCLYDLRIAAMDFFSAYNSSIVKNEIGSPDYVSKAYDVPVSDFVMPLNRFLLMGDESVRKAMRSPSEQFFGFFQEDFFSEEDISAVDSLLLRISDDMLCDQNSPFNGKDAALRNSMVAIICLTALSCFSVFSDGKPGSFPAFGNAIGRMKSKFILDDVVRVAEKSAAKAYERKCSEGEGSDLMAAAWSGTKECYLDAFNGVSKYFSLLSMMNGASSKVYDEYAGVFAIKPKEFTYHVSNKGFKEI